ncbi:nucleoside hydrolase [Rhodobacteraceae bacterium CCMM004]|nr:nucleoside hydrolase [Rhodobacteraceae bacterium CCMM004]
MPRSALIDTDPGIDDALAILAALASPEVEVLGLTTVGGNIGLPRTTHNAGAILGLAGRAEVPVHSGAAAPLSAGAGAATEVHGGDGLGGVALPDPPRAAGAGAVAWMARTLRAAPPGAVDLFTLGPLTNLAQLLSEAPDAARRLGRVIAMGGAVEVPGNAAEARAEFNLAYDPAAAAQVIAAGLPLTLVPLDVTRQVRADRAYVARLAAAGGPVPTVAAALIEGYFAAGRTAESRPLHDPCVPLLAEAPALFDIVRRALAVDPADGALIPGPHAVDVALGVDAAAVLDLLARRLGA